MKKFTKILSLALILGALQLSSFANTGANVSATEAMQKLKAGNQRFIEMKLEHPDQNKERMKELEKSQHPFVAILSCSDSRVPPEIIFDQGLGDIFEIRNAGNVKDDQVIGSIEYAIVHLGVKLVVVLGHQDCGAVKAALDNTKESRYIESLIKEIEPSVKISKGTGNELVTNVAKNHAKLTANKMVTEDPVLSEYVKSHDVKIIPAFYYLDTGKVEFLK